VWQYPAGELMKMSGWVVEDDHVRLRDDSCVQIVFQLLKSLLSPYELILVLVNLLIYFSFSFSNFLI